jgi:hypothetical protein
MEWVRLEGLDQGIESLDKLHGASLSQVFGGSDLSSDSKLPLLASHPGEL